jgi:two-component system sensor histidine kinase KdpD
VAKVTTSLRGRLPSRRVLLGTIFALALATALSAVMFPLRLHLSSGTVAVVLVIPVVAGVMVGGTIAGTTATVAGFVVYDVFFIKPYGTLDVGRGQDWVALFVYLVVDLLLGRVMANLARARSEAAQRQADAERMFQTTELLVGDRELKELLSAVASTVRGAFGLEAVVVLLAGRGGFEVAALSGRPLEADELAKITPSGGRVVAITGEGGGLRSIVLQSAGRAVGILGIAGGRLDSYRERLLRALANETAVALERANLREEALRARVLEEVEGFRQALLGAVSHDLRTPLASIKTSASALRDPGVVLRPEEADELVTLIESQADRLSRMVSNLLDLSRAEAGALELRRGPVALRQVVAEALSLLAPPPGTELLEGFDRRELPAADVDVSLLVEAVVNLVDNALRYSPPGEPVRVVASCSKGSVRLSIVDRGPGMAPGLRSELLDEPRLPSAVERKGIGLGLVITRAFVEANGGKFLLADEPSGGTRATIEVPAYAGDARGASTAGRPS